ncbi:MAG: hypothetical protein M1839_002919 [Geoglossum umbratile]|nr:MAG: hypothetical protein M1839_002919 [Geoglossum umbratile]
MLTHPPHLRIRRPSPTTVEFTVSTASPRDTLSTRGFFLLSLFLRLILFTAVLLVAFAKCNTLSLAAESTILEVLCAIADAVLRRPGIGLVAAWAAERVDWWVLGLAGTAGGYAVFRRGYTEESLLVIRGLGIQTSTTSPTYLSTSASRFIPTNLIQDIFIHEAFKGFEVKFYLAVVVEGEEEVVVVFPVGHSFHYSSYFTGYSRFRH